MVKIDGKAFESVWRELKMRANRLPFAPRISDESVCMQRDEHHSCNQYRQLNV